MTCNVDRMTSSYSESNWLVKQDGLRKVYVNFGIEKQLLRRDKESWALSCDRLPERRRSSCNSTDSTSSIHCVPPIGAKRSITDAVFTCWMPGAVLLIFCKTCNGTLTLSRLGRRKATVLMPWWVRGDVVDTVVVFQDEPGKTVGLPWRVFFRRTNFKMFENFISSEKDHRNS
jgi:hypothetical protein